MNQRLQDNICDDLVFERFYIKHSKNLHDFLYYKFGDHLNPQDKMQEAFIKLWQNCDKISPSKAKSYLFTTANNLMLNAVAHQKVVLKYNRTSSQKNSTNESPEFVMQEKEYHEKLQNALANLTETQRTAFLLNRIEGKRFKEIAELLDITTKAVEKRIYGALKKLRKEIDGL